MASGYPQDVSRHGQHMPSERHPFHSSGFWTATPAGVEDSARTLVTWISQRLSSTSLHTQRHQLAPAILRHTRLVVDTKTLLPHRRRTTGGPPGTTPTPTSGRSHGPTSSQVTRTQCRHQDLPSDGRHTFSPEGHFSPFSISQPTVLAAAASRRSSPFLGGLFFLPVSFHQFSSIPAGNPFPAGRGPF